MKNKTFILLILCLPLYCCTNANNKVLVLNNVYDEYQDKDLIKNKGKYDIKPYFLYELNFLIKKAPFTEEQVKTLQNQLKFEYDESLLKVSSDRNYIDNGDTLTVKYQVEAINDFSKTQLKVKCHNYSTSVSFSSNSDKNNIGNTSITELDENLTSYLDDLYYYSFESKERLKGVDKDLYSHQAGGWNTIDKIDIKTSDVKRFILDCCYVPKEFGDNNYLIYEGRLLNSGVEMEGNPYYSVFISENTYPYPFSYFHTEYENIEFNINNKKAIMINEGFFEAYKDSFLIKKINDIDFYCWKNSEINMPYDLFDNFLDDSINTIFSYKEYMYFINYHQSN